MPLTINDIIDHVRNLSYMSGVERDAVRVKSTGEVFTPTNRVTVELDKLESIDPLLFSDSTKTFLDNSCGDGQFLSEVLIRKIQAGIDFETALSTIYGVEFMQDNVELCRRRLLCGQEHLRHIVEKNIVCADALTYNYTFGETETFGNGLFEMVDI
jgi:type I restriction-modification system DNA methylase subunit